ncbi:PAS domain-containing protein [Desulforamulus hydrothermalis]|nr:PAS domain-containing protein [Desulforamulus hydrothermalis]
MEFRHTNNVINRYESGIVQMAVNKTNNFHEHLKTVTISIAGMLDHQPDMQRFFYDNIYFVPDLVNIYMLKDGKILSSASNLTPDQFVISLAKQFEPQKISDIYYAGIHLDSSSKNEAITTLYPLKNKNATLAVSFRLDRLQNELIQGFINQNYRVAVFDAANRPVLWPFEKVKAASFDLQQDTFYYDNKKYRIVMSEAGDGFWKLYFFFEANNFELYRAITVLLLVFALYVCLYELLVEFWGVNTAKTYFENIDFAIFNQINEGVIIANNSGRILFANEAAHHIFADRKNTLRNIKLKELFGNTDELPKENEGSTTLTLKFRDKLLKAIHSPIIKNNKILGSLTVIRTSNQDSAFYYQILDKLIDALPQGIVFVNKNHEIALANLIAKCYLNNLVPGTSIEVVDRNLAAFIYNQIDSRTTHRLSLSDSLNCEVTPVYDDDGIYAGTLIMLLNNSQPFGS